MENTKEVNKVTLQLIPGVSRAVFRIRLIFFCGSGSTDPYSEFMDPDPTHLPASANKNTCLNHPTTMKHSHNGEQFLSVTKGKKLNIYKTSYYQFGNIMFSFLPINRPEQYFFFYGSGSEEQKSNGPERIRNSDHENKKWH